MHLTSFLVMIKVRNLAETKEEMSQGSPSIIAHFDKVNRFLMENGWGLDYGGLQGI